MMSLTHHVTSSTHHAWQFGCLYEQLNSLYSDGYCLADSSTIFMPLLNTHALSCRARKDTEEYGR